MGSNSANVRSTEVKTEIFSEFDDVLDNVMLKERRKMFYEFDDALDNIILKERRKMLASRKLMLSSTSNMEEKNFLGLSNLSRGVLQTAKSDSVWYAPIGKDINLENGCVNMSSEFAIDGTFCTSDSCSLPSPGFAARSIPLSTECKSFGTQKSVMVDACALASSVKDEPLDINELSCEGENILKKSCVGQTLTVKNEPGFSNILVDELDHMPLIDRVKLLSCGIPSMDVPRNPRFFKEDVTSAMDIGNDVLESGKPVSMSRPRKKRRTVTDSVETALEEDAPGLLKVLLDKGVSPEEIKLYGEEDTDDILDDSLNLDGFAELEAVISQLFSLRQTFLKFPLLRTKGEKISYCLSCLFSLVEQTKYMQNRKWPVEWGWCRDLQSFLFVFQRHNRIVLERPEYGYATYFFELLNSVPVAWQVKRLVTAMRLTSCGRITLIEDRPLVE